jgi:hypothetical protein
MRDRPRFTATFLLLAVLTVPATAFSQNAEPPAAEEPPTTPAAPPAPEQPPAEPAPEQPPAEPAPEQPPAEPAPEQPPAEQPPPPAPPAEQPPPPARPAPQPTPPAQQPPAQQPPPQQPPPQDPGYGIAPPPGGSYRESYGVEREGGYGDDYGDQYGDEGGDDGDDGDDGEPFDMPPIGIRIDPFNWLIEGRLGLELEVGIWKFISLELVPVFVLNDSPPSFNFSGREDNLFQESNGLGPISGTSIGVGFWLGGDPLEGYVIRAVFTNYGYTYKTTSDEWGTIDEVDFTERRLGAVFGSHYVWGPFTIAFGFGLGVELNQQERCFPDADITNPQTSDCPYDDEQHIALDRVGNTADTVTDLNGWLHPVYLMGRISLGLYLDF